MCRKSIEKNTKKKFNSKGVSKSSIICSDLMHILKGNKVNSKNLYHETFFSYFLTCFKKHHINFYQPDSITMLKYDSFRPVLKCNSFKRHLYYYNRNYIFFSPSIRMSGMNIIFNDNKIKESNFYKNKILSKIDEIDIDKILVSKRNHMVQKSHLNTSLDIMMMMMSLVHYV